MPVCPVCGKQLLCTAHASDLNAVVKPCPKDLPGSLWVRVLDEERNGVPGIDVTLTGDSGGSGNTDGSGFKGFDDLKAGPYKVALGAVPEGYEAPAEKSKNAVVEKGGTRVASFRVLRLAKLKVQIVAHDSDAVIENPAIKVTRTSDKGADKPAETKKGLHDFGYVLPGKQKLEVSFADPGLMNYKLLKTVDEVTLKGGGDETVKFKVQPLVKLDVEIFLKGPPEKVAENPVITVTSTASTGEKEERNTVKGKASFGYLPAGKYKVSVALKDKKDEDFFEFETVAQEQKKWDDPYVELDKSEVEVELKVGEDKLERFYIEPLYKTVRFVGHCLATVAKQIWLPAGQVLWDSTYKTAEPGIQQYWLKGEGAQYWKAQYSGKAIELDDVKARVDFIEKVLAKAKSSIVEKDDELKVFAMPECYFLAKYGAYEVEAVSALIGKLQQLVKGPEWRHWLFVFGTISSVYYKGTKNVDDLTDYKRVVGMFNISPVIRGGFESDDQAPAYTKTIQKVTWCAEMLALSDLETAPTSPLGHRLPPPKKATDKAGESVVSETVGSAFGDTEVEHLLGLKLQELLGDPEPLVNGSTIASLFTGEGLTAEHWTDLKGVVKGEITSKGLTWVTRRMRSLPAPLRSKRFDELEFYGEQRGKIDNLTGVQDITVAEVTWTAVAKAYLQAALAADPRTTVMNWKKLPLPERIPKLRKLLELCNGDLPLVTGIAFQRERLKARVSAMIAEVETNNGATLDKVLTAFAPTNPWVFDWAPVLCKLFHLYLAGDAKTAFEQVQFKFDDFAFQCRRRPGRLLPSGSLPAAKKIFFGHEICADHSEGRLLAMVMKMNKPLPTIDIQLIPSAGMGITDIKIVARADGFVFNCDGWGAVASMMKTIRARNSKILEFKNASWPLEPGKNPLFPHSELAKSTGTGTPSTAITGPNVVPLTDLNDDVKDLFGYGAGELHIYKSQDLPPPA